MDENIEYLNTCGELLAYTSGENGTYHALALVKSGDEFMVWHNSKELDYESIKPRYTRYMSDYQLMEEDERLSQAVRYFPEDGEWETLEEDNEEDARRAYDAIVRKVGRLRPMNTSEIEELLDNEMRYKGREYSAWEPNF